MKQIIKGLAVTACSVAALSLIPAIASAQPALQLGDKAKLVANGAAITVPVIVTCDAGSGILSLSGQVTQAVGKRLAQASGFAATPGIICDSAPHTIDIFMHANIQGVPFKKGVAAASANFTFCEPSPSFVCRGISDTGAIQIVR